ncbi:monooxygenase [Aspergillus nanangensis]|uniref:Monooxygenase n=1 Tax=Aspergillus nanangensis TaxID=2582783 RepID=A0AAD4CJD0_ASPNN|nr:monooxygenase [Aspergillus nanangensis]
MSRAGKISRVAVIGAGPTGLSAAKYLLAENYFEKIDVFEKRSSVGGVWNYFPGAFKQSLATCVPQLDPNHPAEEPVWRTTGDAEGSRGLQEPVFISPIYKTLDTNIPKELMAYGEKAFPANAQVLPKYSTVKEYLEEYAEEVKDIIQFETEVLSVEQNPDKMGTWYIITRNIRTGARQTRSYDAVVAASGHFDVPYLPDISGIKHWNEMFPGVISHSNLFDTPEDFRGIKVLVVGASASAIDIGNQINAVSKGKLLISQRSESHLLPSTASDKLYFPEIVEFLPSDRYTRAVRFADGSVETGIDSIVFCTGYLYSFPYLSALDPPVVTDGRRVLNTYQHLFYIYNTTLVFPVLPQRVIPFPLSENQAAVFARVWSGRLTVPPVVEMKAWEDATAIEKGDGTSFHLMPFPLDAQYMNLMHEWAAQAELRPWLINDGQGKSSNYWGIKEKWMRQLFPEIRKTFVSKGEERRSITSLKQLGYDFDAREEAKN